MRRDGERDARRDERERDARAAEAGRIAGSECKSTASDQSATRTTRNRKDSLFSFSWNFLPALVCPFPSSCVHPRRLPRLFCLLAGYFSPAGAFPREEKGTLCRTAHKVAPKRSCLRDSISIAVESAYRYRDFARVKWQMMSHLHAPVSNAFEISETHQSGSSKKGLKYCVPLCSLQRDVNN